MTRQPQLLTQALVGFAFAIGATVTFSQPSHTQERDRFFCRISNGQPTTMIRNTWGPTPMIHWVNSFPNWTPARRCEDVSTRFQRFYRNGTLKYLKGGWYNNQPVLCVAAYKGGDCFDVLVTLKPGSDPEETLRLLINYKDLPLSLSSGFISTVDGQLYFNIDFFITEVYETESIILNPEEPPKGLIWEW
jgi:hypothetical protein